MNLLKNDGGLSQPGKTIKTIQVIGSRNIATEPIKQHKTMREAQPYIVLGGDIDGNG